MRPGLDRTACLRWLRPLALACLFTGLLYHAVFSVSDSGDYVVGGLVGGDNNAPAITSLLHGHLWGFFSHQPIIGLTSILLRLPFTALAGPLGGGSLRGYQLGALACLLPLALGGAWLVCVPGLRLEQRLVRVAAVLLVITSGVLRSVVELGHPEGVLAGVLAVGAVLAANQGRAGWSAVLLGLAAGTKEWAIVAVLPVMLALPGRRRRVAAVSAAVFTVMSVAVVVDPAGFLRALHGEGGTEFVNPLSLLWPVAAPVHLPGGQLAPARELPLGLTRAGATLLTFSAAGPIFTAWLLYARRRNAVCNPLAMLALLGMLRCALDTTQLEYYSIAALIPVAAWEATENRLPLMTGLILLRISMVYSLFGRVSDTDLYISSMATRMVLIPYLASRAMVLPRDERWSVAARRLAVALAAMRRQIRPATAPSQTETV